MTKSKEQLVRAFIMTAIVVIGLLAAGKLFVSLWRRFHSVERISIEGIRDLSDIEREHVARYEFAKAYCKAKTVADIASGSGYGTRILRTVAARVDGYDREKIGQEFVIDLEKESWDRRYDVIVSFETIEHLSNPEFFLSNVKKTARMLILSTPLNERTGWSSPYHKQGWTDKSIRALLDNFFSCSYRYQHGLEITQSTPEDARCIVAVCSVVAQP